MLRKLLPALLVATTVLPAAAVLTAPAPAMAQSQPADQVRVRGSVISLGDKALKVKTREGSTVDVTLANGWKVSGVAKAAITDIKPGDYVGIASLRKADGGDGALEVLIFPPALKGAGEGSHGWDLKPNSSMTNATVADAVKGVDGQTVTVSYQGKEKKISIPDGTPVVTLAPATKDDLIPGAIVFITAVKDPSGTLATRQIVVGTHGVVPPM
ncbi:hypothetical protein GCM10011611_16570 [Aliidongia dinghuensis]|uniref:DUF5666 domain-containing protein n=1 Tax=Aliidongia dinghuensis TaxID=1867774 RepID=A0A8J2YT44_9PROT|nr:hypothetical protein [Aliidongia dinghuensis]GGF11577.1 hypothetical protein GCM10011611_16570 [Aliidongia dinghuensis]